MISLYSGTPGSGKSLHTAKEIRDQLRYRDCIVIGNFFFNEEAVKKRKGLYIYCDNMELSAKRLIDFSYALRTAYGRRLKEGEVTVYIDEAQLIFNSRSWEAKGRHEWISFFTQHRHLGYNIVLIAQFDRMLDRQIRYLLEYDYVHRNVGRFGKFGAFLALFTHGSLFCVIKKWAPNGEVVDKSFFVGNKKIYDLYDSYNLFDAQPDRV